MSYFSSKLKELRKGRRISQDELARALDVSRSTVGMYEQARREPDFETLEAIADFFNVSLASLVDAGTAVAMGITDPASPEELDLIRMYRTLNKEGRDRLSMYAEDLVASGRYIYAEAAAHKE